MAQDTQKNKNWVPGGTHGSATVYCPHYKPGQAHETEQKPRKNRRWYLSGESFQKNRVYDQLKAMDMNCVVGMDIGHGESVLYVFTRKKKEANGTVKDVSTVERRQMNFGDDAKIPTIIGFQENKTIIGKDAKEIEGFIQHFKVEPALWNNIVPTGTYTHRELMRDFIRILWRGTLKYDQNLAQLAKEGKVLITVGCPSSPAWTNEEAVKDYRKLVTEATGCPHVAILPESTAAIMSAILNINEEMDDEEMDPDGEDSADGKKETKKRSVNLSGGLAVIDAGSSTIDFTYVLLGKKLITCSLDVAGKWLDEQILAVALEESGLTLADIPKEQLPEIKVQIREIKETFYPKQHALSIRMIPIWGVDAQGKPDRYVSSGKMLQFVVNQEFMSKALNRAKIRRGPGAAAKSWLEHCESFISDCRVLIPKDAKGELLCDTVIVTGGTSYVGQFYEAVEAAYSKDKVFASRDRSSSVARGLCYAKGLEIKGSKEVDGYKKIVGDLADKQHEAFLQDVSAYVTGEVCSDMQNVISYHVKNKKKVTAGELVDLINTAARQNEKIFGKACADKVQEIFVEHYQKTEASIHEAVNKISQNVYGANMTSIPETPKLSEKELKNLAQNISLSDLIGDSWVNSLVATANLSMLSGILLFLGLACFDSVALAPVAPVFLGLAFLVGLDGFQQKLMEFIVKNKTVLQPWMLKPILKKLVDKGERGKLESKSAKKSAETMKNNGIMRKEFVSFVEEQAEFVLGKVLFLTYDEKPDLR